jgi:hypothetical protein
VCGDVRVMKASLGCVAHRCDLRRSSCVIWCLSGGGARGTTRTHRDGEFTCERVALNETKPLWARGLKKCGARQPRSPNLRQKLLAGEKSLASQLSKCHPWAIELLPNIGESIASLFSASQRKTICSCRAPKLRAASREQKQ